MHYLLLGIAIIAEIFATSLLKQTEGFTKLIPTLSCVAGYLVCYFCMAKALTHVKLGPAYAVWCGAGIVVTSIVGVLYYHEKLSITAVIGLVLILAGCVLVNLSD